MFSRILIATLGIALIGQYSLFAQDRAQDRQPNTDEAFETDVLIVVKSFWIAVRDNNGAKLCNVLDPEYVTEHQLADNAISFPKISTSNLYDVRIAADKATVMCQILKDDDTTSILLLRVVKRGDSLFVQPPDPPAEDSNLVMPWLLHAKLAT